MRGKCCRVDSEMMAFVRARIISRAENLYPVILFSNVLTPKLAVIVSSFDLCLGKFSLKHRDVSN
jgi:hypothetical protein